VNYTTDQVFGRISYNKNQIDKLAWRFERSNNGKLLLFKTKFWKRQFYSELQRGEVSEWLKEHAWPPPMAGSRCGGKSVNTMYFIYIIQSQKTSKYYVGSTAEITKRLREHNSGSTRSTKHGIPWHLVYQEECASKSEALFREKKIKSYKGGNAFKKLIGLH
jgi:putative endonuclease